MLNYKNAIVYAHSIYVYRNFIPIVKHNLILYGNVLGRLLFLIPWFVEIIQTKYLVLSKKTLVICVNRFVVRNKNTVGKLKFYLTMFVPLSLSLESRILKL